MTWKLWIMGSPLPASGMRTCPMYRRLAVSGVSTLASSSVGWMGASLYTEMTVAAGRTREGSTSMLPVQPTVSEPLMTCDR